MEVKKMQMEDLQLYKELEDVLKESDTSIYMSLILSLIFETLVEIKNSMEEIKKCHMMQKQN